MYKVAFLFPSTENQKTQPQERPSSCPYCGHSRFTRHGTLSRQMRGGKTISVQRYRCNWCGGTFRIYPEGISHSRTSSHVIAVVTFLWATGISGRSVAQATKELGVPVSVATAWRFGNVVGSHHPRGHVPQNAMVILGEGENLEDLEITNPEKTILLRVLKDPKNHAIGLDVWFEKEVELGKVKKLALESGCWLMIETNQPAHITC